jgi:RNA-directed DNA polymerase
MSRIHPPRAERLQRLQQQLQRGDYQPKPVKRVWMPKLGSKELRPLGIPAVEDRVTQTALRNVIEPIFVTLCPTKEEAQETLQQLRQWVQKAGLVLHPVKTRIVDAHAPGGFDFPGYHLERGHRWPREKSLQKFRDAIRQKTPRLRPDSMSLIVGEVNRTLRGWFEYFKHSIANVMEREDKWVRHRLRAILRKRHCRRQRDKRPRKQRWPNACFAELGLFSLAIARDKASQLQR